MPEPLLEARRIVKSFGRVQALRGASFTVYPAEVVALVGDNGAGKSTLVKTLAGVHQPDAGEIIFEGEQASLHSPLDARRLGIETVYQDLALAADLDASANMFLGRAVMRRGVDEREVPFKLIDTIGTGRLFHQIPYLVIIAFAVTIVFGVVLAATRFGRYTYAIGSNEEAARRAGIAVDRHLMKVYALAGTLAGLAGFLSLARFSTTTIGGHDTDNLSAIAAVVIGGTSLFGGIGTMLGSVFGVFIPAVLENGFVIVGVNPFWQEIAVGAVLVGAVILDFQGPDKFDASLQTPVVNAVAAKKPDAVLVAPTDTKAMYAPIKQLSDGGSKVALVDTTLEQADFAVSQIASDNEGGGKAAADTLGKLIGGKGKVFVVNVTPGISTTDARGKGFQDAAKAAGLTFVGQQYDNDDPAKAAAIVKAELAKDPDLKGIF